MKEIVRFNASIFQANICSGWQDLVRSHLEPMHPSTITVSPFGQFVEFAFDHYPKGLDEVVPLLRTHRISSSIWVRREYGADELLEAEWLTLGTEDVVGSLDESLNRIVLASCPYCGFQERGWDYESLSIRETPEGYRLAMVDWHPQVVTSSLAKELHETGFTGLTLIPVSRGRQPRWYAIQAYHPLEPLLSPPTRLPRSPRSTPRCAGDHNWTYPSSEFFYRREGFRALDFNVTYEFFGDPQSSARALVVSNRVYRLLMQLGVEKLVAEPVRLLP